VPHPSFFEGWDSTVISRLGFLADDEVALVACGVVIPSKAKDLQFAAKCRSLTSFGMTILERLSAHLKAMP